MKYFILTPIGAGQAIIVIKLDLLEKYYERGCGSVT